jgi:hypothetical protein
VFARVILRQPTKKATEAELSRGNYLMALYHSLPSSQVGDEATAAPGGILTARGFVL